MIHDGEIEIRLRTLTRDVFSDDFPIDFFKGLVNHARRRINKKSFRIIKREYVINTYPEE